MVRAGKGAAFCIHSVHKPASDFTAWEGGKRGRSLPEGTAAPTGAVEEWERIVGQIRAAWPEGKIILRADSGFCREAILAWCEQH